MSFIDRAPSSANPTALTPSSSLSSLSSSSNGTFQQSGERTPPCGVPRCSFRFTFEPRSSELITLLVTKDSYQDTKSSGNPLSLIADNAFSVFILLKAPSISMKTPRVNSFLRIPFSASSTTCTRAVSTFLTRE